MVKENRFFNNQKSWKIIYKMAAVCGGNMVKNCN